MKTFHRKVVLHWPSTRTLSYNVRVMVGTQQQQGNVFQLCYRLVVCLIVLWTTNTKMHKPSEQGLQLGNDQSTWFLFHNRVLQIHTRVKQKQNFFTSVVLQFAWWSWSGKSPAHIIRTDLNTWVYCYNTILTNEYSFSSLNSNRTEYDVKSNDCSNKKILVKPVGMVR